MQTHAIVHCRLLLTGRMFSLCLQGRTSLRRYRADISNQLAFIQLPAHVNASVYIVPHVLIEVLRNEEDVKCTCSCTHRMSVRTYVQYASLYTHVCVYIPHFYCLSNSVVSRENSRTMRGMSRGMCLRFSGQ